LPTSDLAFKKILASEDHKSVTRGFIKDFFGVDVELDDIRIVNPYSIKAYPKPGRGKRRGKGQMLRETRRDITIEATVADVTVEMQLYWDPAFVLRSLYYALDLFMRRYGLNRDTDTAGGVDGFAGLVPVWSISILGRPYFEDTRAYRMGVLCDEDTGELFEPRLIRWGFYELTKTDDNAARARWARFLQTGVATADDPEYLREAASIIDTVNMTPEERDMITEQQKAEDRYWGGLRGAKIEGIRDAKLDAARAALGLHLTHDQVMAITGLDAATVNRLADELGLTVA